MPRAVLCLAQAAFALVGFAAGAAAQSAGQSSATLRWESSGTTLKFGVETGAQLVWAVDPFWNLAETFAPTANFDPTRHWWEGYLKPSLRADMAVSAGSALYWGISAIGTYTVREDVFLEGNTGDVLMEDYYGGVTFTGENPSNSLDLSGGAQQYKIGSGMLIANGGGNGFERGALIFGPRRAWEMTGLARASLGAVSLDAFYLDAAELESNDTKTELAGGKIELALAKNEMIGLVAGKVLQSEAPYVQAAPFGAGIPTIILGGRDDMEFVHGYSRFNPMREVLPGFWLGAEGVYEHNDRIKMEAWAGRAEVGNAFTELPWAPVLSYAFQTFSGDDPDTVELERYDPLFYDGAPGAWTTGGNASLTLVNTNVKAHRISLTLNMTAQDILTLRYWHIRANELNSPLQFGQATRLSFTNGLPALASGVPDPHLSDDVLAEYTRVISPNAYLTVGFGISVPGSGIEAITNGSAENWLGGFGNIVLIY